MAFDLGLVEDAYTAALSNPQHDMVEEKVRRLVLALVEQGETHRHTRTCAGGCTGPLLAAQLVHTHHARWCGRFQQLEPDCGSALTGRCALLPAGQLQQLLNLPWAGVLALKRENLTEPVPVVEVRHLAILGLHARLHAGRGRLAGFTCNTCQCVPACRHTCVPPQRHFCWHYIYLNAATD